MSRLTKFDRENMARALVRHKMDERGNTLVAEAKSLFAAAYAERYPDETRKLMAKLVTKHPGAFRTSNYLQERARGMWCTIGRMSFGAEGCGWQAECDAWPMFSNDEKSPLSAAMLDKIADFNLRAETFSEDVSAAYRKALGTLGQFSTGKKLATDWPEAMPVIGKLIPEDDRTLPVVQLASINAEFDLPPEGLAA